MMLDRVSRLGEMRPLILWRLSGVILCRQQSRYRHLETCYRDVWRWWERSVRGEAGTQSHGEVAKR
jgi:hypothetical protein